MTLQKLYVFLNLKKNKRLYTIRKGKTMSIDNQHLYKTENLAKNNQNINKIYKPRKIYNVFWKRSIDFILASVLTTIAFPFFLIFAVLIKFDSKGPVFYRGLRTGYHGKKFRIYKFRSMIINADRLGGGTTALNDSRITYLGKFLRKTKIDETPQLINILLGEMSFVGPRPELPMYTDKYQNLEKIILDVRPGITDFSSLHFINLDEIVGEFNADVIFENLVLNQKNQLRVKYVLEQNILVDLKIFFLTIIKVLNKGFLLIFKKNNRKAK